MDHDQINHCRQLDDQREGKKTEIFYEKNNLIGDQTVDLIINQVSDQSKNPDR